MTSFLHTLLTCCRENGNAAEKKKKKSKMQGVFKTYITKHTTDEDSHESRHILRERKQNGLAGQCVRFKVDN